VLVAEVKTSTKSKILEDEMPCLSLVKGQELAVIAELNETWTIVEIQGHRGLAPTSALQLRRVLPNPSSSSSTSNSKLLAAKKELRLSTLKIELRFKQVATGLVDRYMSKTLSPPQDKPEEEVYFLYIHIYIWIILFFFFFFFSIGLSFPDFFLLVPANCFL